VGTLESVLFQTVTLKPFLSKFMDMAFPIIPNPKNPTSIFFSLYFEEEEEEEEETLLLILGVSIYK
jgi:hypothetical protein